MRIEQIQCVRCQHVCVKPVLHELCASISVFSLLVACYSTHCTSMVAALCRDSGLLSDYRRQDARCAVRKEDIPGCHAGEQTEGTKGKIAVKQEHPRATCKKIKQI